MNNVENKSGNNLNNQYAKLNVQHAIHPTSPQEIYCPCSCPINKLSILQTLIAALLNYIYFPSFKLSAYLQILR